MSLPSKRSICRPKHILESPSTAVLSFLKQSKRPTVQRGSSMLSRQRFACLQEICSRSSPNSMPSSLSTCLETCATCPACREAAQGKPIIEDCAQSLGSKLNGRTAGSFGTIAAFSFRSGKYLSVGEGGALFSNQPEVCTRLSEIISNMPVPGRAEECFHVAKTYIRSKLRSKTLWGLAGYRVWSIYNKTVQYSAKSPIALSQIYRSDLALTTHRLAFLESAIETQRANADFYSKTLNLDSDMLCSEKPGTFYNRFQYPIILPSSEERDLIAAYLRSHKVDTAKPYHDIAEIAAEYYGYAGDCPAAEQIAKRVLVIPCNYSLRKRDVKRIALRLNEGWREIASRGAHV